MRGFVGGPDIANTEKGEREKGEKVKEDRRESERGQEREREGNKRGRTDAKGSFERFL